MNVCDWSNADRLGQRPESADRHRARDHTVPDRRNESAFVGTHVDPGVKTFRAFHAARFTAGARDLERALHGRDWPEQRRQREPFSVELRRDQRRGGRTKFEAVARDDQP